MKNRDGILILRQINGRTVGYVIFKDGAMVAVELTEKVSNGENLEGVYPDGRTVSISGLTVNNMMVLQTIRS